MSQTIVIETEYHLYIKMKHYYINKRANSTGEHEVHVEGCKYLPEESNRIDLGVHEDCSSALLEARKYYPLVDGCYFCCYVCHTR